MYYLMDSSDPFSGQTVRNIFRHLADGGVQSFPDVDSNSGPERAAFLEWVAAGGVPEPWPTS